jgi:hypothetical protein
VIWLRPFGPEDTTATDMLRRWSDKYPDVAVATTTRYGIDRAIAMAAASHSAQLVVVGLTSRPVAQGIARALIDRAACPVAIVPVQGRPVSSEGQHVTGVVDLRGCEMRRAPAAASTGARLG